MNVLEKILEEIKQPTNYTIMCGKHFTTVDRVEEIIRSYMNELPNGIKEVSKEQLNQIPVATPEFLQECKATAEKYEKGKRMKDDSIDRKALKEEIESLTMTITGMRSGKTMTTQALQEYKKSILRIIDEQPTVHANDGWIPAEERLPYKGENMTESEKSFWLDGEDGLKPYLRSNGMPKGKIEQIAWLLLNGSGCGFCKVCRDKPCEIKEGERCTANIARYIRETVLNEVDH